jgi:hypothetical protein
MKDQEPWNPKTDHITVRVECFFSFWDRLRILWHGRANVTAEVYAERHPGETRSLSLAYVPRIREKALLARECQVEPG